MRGKRLSGNSGQEKLKSYNYNFLLAFSRIKCYTDSRTVQKACFFMPKCSIGGKEDHHES